MLKLETGDIIFTNKDSMIAKFMAHFQSDPVFWGHIMVAKNDTILYEPTNPLTTTTTEQLEKTKKHYKIVRYKHITDEDKEKIQKFLDKLVGAKYSFRRLILQAFDHIFHTNWFSNGLHSPDNQVCSSMAAWAYYASMKIKFNGVSWRSCEPDDIEDHIEKNSNDWMIIAKK